MILHNQGSSMYLLIIGEKNNTTYPPTRTKTAYGDLKRHNNTQNSEVVIVEVIEGLSDSQ
jgi:hypothetical protein